MDSRALILLTTLGLIGCNSPAATVPESAAPTAPSAVPASVTLVGLNITGGNEIRGRSQTLQLRAVARYSDGTTRDQTDSVKWTSSNAVVASVSDRGLVTTSAFGQVSIFVELQSVTANITISVAPITITFEATSEGASANAATCGGVTLRRNGATFYSGFGCRTNGARGFNVAAISGATGELLTPVQNFDLWFSGESAARAMMAFLNSQPPGTVLLIAVGDEAGMTVGATAGCPRNPPAGSVCCQPLGDAIETLRQQLESLGARQIRQLCYWNSYSLAITKGVGANAEQLERTSAALTTLILTLP